MTATTPKRSLNLRALFEDLGYEPHPGQWQVHRSTASRRILACGVRWGKTKCAAMEGLAAALQPAGRSVGWVVAPTYDLADRVFREMQVVVFEKLKHRVVAMKEQERRIVLRNMAGGLSEIRGKTADNPVSLLGEGLDWVIVDEAARLKPAIWDSHLTQRLVDKNGWALLISTPKGKGYFYDLFRRGQGRDSDFESWNLPSWTNPHLDREVIEAERGRLAERVFAQEYGARFVEGSGAVFRDVRECATGDWKEPDPEARYFAGLDLARVEDYTVVVVVSRKGEVVAADRFHRLDWARQVTRIRALTERYRVLELLVDSTGAGEPIYESLKTAGCPARPYAFTQKSKSALVDNLALMVERRDLVLPRPEVWPELIDEMEAFQYSVTEHGNVRSGAPSGDHDDCVVALALAAWCLKRDARPRQMTTGPLLIPRSR
ncbi:MAG: hypothetical protein H6674_09310 [Dehalococcoidia bacterium]|nr:hypothetical protein [Dehalococcoidia bacterium]